jgi:hypothetical protein
MTEFVLSYPIQPKVTVTAPKLVSVEVSPVAKPLVTVTLPGGTVSESGMRKYSQLLSGTSSPEVLTHYLGTQKVLLNVFNTVTGEVIALDWESTSSDLATVHYNPNIGDGFMAVVVG